MVENVRLNTKSIHLKLKKSRCVTLVKTGQDKRLAKRSWHFLPSFAICPWSQLTANLCQFSLSPSCVITTALMSDSCYLVVSFQSTFILELPESLLFGRSASTPQHSSPDAIIESYANRKPERCACLVDLAVWSLSANDIITFSIPDYNTCRLPWISRGIWK